MNFVADCPAELPVERTRTSSVEGPKMAAREGGAFDLSSLCFPLPSFLKFLILAFGFPSSDSCASLFQPLALQ
jgi:hypothetical protein